MPLRSPVLSRLRLALAAALAFSTRPAPASVPEPASVPARPPTADTIPREWLDGRISVEEAEAAHPGITDERIRRYPEAARPFGFMNRRWEALKAEMKPGDALYTFASPAESWRHLAGRAGIALVRDGTVVDAIVVAMN